MISKKHNCIFVHIPKVAGQSIETVFLNDLGLSWQNREALLLRKKTRPEPGPFRLAHLKAKDYIALGYIDKVEFNSYFKFSFVRNPYARTLSLYKYLGYARILSFSNFVTKVLPKMVKEQHFFFIPQYEYLYDDNQNLLVDFVGKLETIEQDCKVVFKKIGLEDTILPHINKSGKGLKRGVGLLLKNPSLIKFFVGKRLFSSAIKTTVSASDKQAIQEVYNLDFQYFDYER